VVTVGQGRKEGTAAAFFGLLPSKQSKVFGKASKQASKLGRPHPSSLVVQIPLPTSSIIILLTFSPYSLKCCKAFHECPNLEALVNPSSAFHDLRRWRQTDRQTDRQKSHRHSEREREREREREKIGYVFVFPGQLC
jgi:hypothetical protein